MYEGFDRTYQSKSLSMLAPQLSLKETSMEKNQNNNLLMPRKISSDHYFNDKFKK